MSCARCNADLSAAGTGAAYCPRCLLRLGMGEEEDDSEGFLTGEQLGPYAIVELLGDGGMGQVYAARDTRLGRTVALKVLPPDLAADPARLARFRREARAVAALSHPGVVTIHSIEEAEGLHFLTMERVEGVTLDRLIPEGGLPAEQLLPLALAVAEALEAAHARGVVHRDLKPTNVMVDAAGRPKLLDFGLAHSENGFGGDDPELDLTLTQQGAVLGTLPYMAPEQLQGFRVDARSDQFSLGALIYEMATGRRPFRGRSRAELLAAILKDEPAPLSELRPDLSPGLEEALRRCLEKDPVRRFRDVGELTAALHRIAGGASVTSGEEGVRAPASSEPRQVPPSDFFSGLTPGEPKSIGRADELAQLSAWLDEALSGSRRIVFVTGGSGMGKSALVGSFLAEARKRHHFWLGYGQCLERGGSGEAYMPVLEALGRMCRGEDGGELVALLGRLAPTWLAQMPALVSETRRAELEKRVLGSTRERMLREMVEALETLAARRPVVLVLEDLHWSDYSTVDLVEALARRPDRARLLVVSTFRHQELKARRHPLHRLARDLRSRTPEQCVELPLKPLPETAVAEYLERRFPGAALPEGLVGLLHRRTEGHPLFLTTVVESWISRGLAVEEKDGWALDPDLDPLCAEIPETLRQMIERHLEELDPEDRQLLEVAAVAGARFSAALVAAGSDRSAEETESRCSALARDHRFLRPRGAEEWPDGTVAARFGFGHHLVQEVLYEGIPPARRSRLHLQMGERLERGWSDASRERSAELAVHFLHGRDAPRAVRHFRLAAEHTLGRSAHREAIDLIDQALDLLPRLTEGEERQRAELSLQALRAPALIAIEGWTSSDAERSYLRALELTRELADDEQRSRVLYGLATMRELRGEYQQSQALLEQRLCVPVADPEASESLETHELLACSLFHQGHFSRALDQAKHGLELFHPERHRSLLAQENLGVSCHDWAALSLWFLGLPDRALREAERALALADELDHPYTLAHAHNQAAMLRQLRQEVAPTRDEAKTTLALAREFGFPYRIATGEILLGWTTTADGDPEEGVERLRRGLDTCRRMGAELDLPYFQGLLVDALHRGGRTGEALEVVGEALAAQPTPRESFFEAELHRLRGLLLLENGSEQAAEKARTCFERAIEVARRQGARSLELRAAVELAELVDKRGTAGQRNGQGAKQGVWRRVADLYHGFGEGLDTVDLRRAHTVLQSMGPAA